MKMQGLYTPNLLWRDNMPSSPNTINAPVNCCIQCQYTYINSDFKLTTQRATPWQKQQSISKIYYTRSDFQKLWDHWYLPDQILSESNKSNNNQLTSFVNKYWWLYIEELRNTSNR